MMSVRGQAQGTYRGHIFLLHKNASKHHVLIMFLDFCQTNTSPCRTSRRLANCTRKTRFSAAQRPQILELQFHELQALIQTHPPNGTGNMMGKNQPQNR